VGLLGSAFPEAPLSAQVGVNVLEEDVLRVDFDNVPFGLLQLSSFKNRPSEVLEIFLSCDVRRVK